MRGARREFRAFRPTLLKAGGEALTPALGRGPAGGARLSPARRTGGEGREAAGVAGWASSPVTWESGAERSSRQHGDPGSGGLMFNWSYGRPAVPPPAPLGAGGGGSVAAVPSHPPGPHRHPSTCRPPGAPRGCQLLEVARVERWKMLWVGSKGLKGQHPSGSP